MIYFNSQINNEDKIYKLEFHTDIIEFARVMDALYDVFRFPLYDLYTKREYVGIRHPGKFEPEFVLKFETGNYGVFKIIEQTAQLCIDASRSTNVVSLNADFIQTEHPEKYRKEYGDNEG